MKKDLSDSDGQSASSGVWEPSWSSADVEQWSTTRLAESMLEQARLTSALRAAVERVRILEAQIAARDAQ